MTHVSLKSELAAGVAALDEHDVLTIVELAEKGVVIWRVGRDPNGTPHCRHWPALPWPEFEQPHGLGEATDAQINLNMQKLREIALPAAGRPVVLVCGFAAGPLAHDAFDALTQTAPSAPAFVYPGSLGELLGEVLASDRLTQFYELVVLRESTSGRPELALCQLFPQGAERGETQQVSVRCEAGDERGTVFAVVAVAPGRSFRLVSVRSASLPPGSYTLTAELRGPGQVYFRGLGQSQCDERRSWSELMAGLPERLDLPKATHLICMVEVSGTSDELDERLLRIGQLIEAVPGAPAGQVFSLVSYGPHAIGDLAPEEPSRVLTWAQSAGAALAEVDKLRDRGAVRGGYARAAQLECALAEVERGLGPGAQRCVLVTIGSRPAFPARRDLVTEIIPCPRKNDWRTVVRRLQRHAVAFGAILDCRSDDAIWDELGSGARVYGTPVDVPGFAARLGLVSAAARSVPFPLAELEGG